MKEFKIYYDGLGEDTLNFKKFAKEIENDINSDPERIEKAKEINSLFAEKIKEALSDPENTIFAGTMVASIRRNIPRYSYIKEVPFGGKFYDIEIDYLERTFSIVEI